MLSVSRIELLVAGFGWRVLGVVADIASGDIVAGTVGELCDGIFTIEHGTSLLEGTSLGLGSPEPDVDQLEHEPASVDEVVLPLESTESDGVGVLVEDDGTHDGKVHDRETLGTDEVWQDFDGVGDEEGSIGDGVETVEDEDECEEGTTSSCSGSLFKRGGHGGNDGIRDKHTSGRDDEERATASLLDGHRGGDSDDKVVDGEDTVDESLIVGAGDSDTVEDLVEVVRDDTVSRPLREYTDTDDDPHAAAITWSAEQVDPRDAGSLRFESNGLFDFVVLESDQGMVEITTSVISGDDRLGTLVLTPVDQPTRRLWDEPHKEQLDDRREGLEDGRDTPRPIAVDTEGTESRPSGNDGAREPECVVERGKRSTVSRVSDFGNQEWRGHLSKRGTETDAETSADEHAEALGGGLEDSSDQDDYSTDDDTPFAAETVRDVGGNGDGAEGTDGLNGIEETEILVGGVVEIVLPVLDRLETVHHGTIETVGVRGDERDDEQQVEPDNVAVLPPFARVKQGWVRTIARDLCETSVRRHRRG